MASAETKPVSADEFYEFVTQPENRNRYFELDCGEVIETPPPGKYHGFVCGNVSRILGNYVVAIGKGYVCSSDAGILVDEEPDTVRGPDITLYIDQDTSESMTRGYAESPPILAVEVLSPTDRSCRCHDASCRSNAQPWCSSRLVD